MEFIRIKVLSIRVMLSMMVILLPYSCQPGEEGPFIVVETGGIDKIGPTFCTVSGEILALNSKLEDQ